MEIYNILIVDDDREIVKSLGKLLELEGYGAVSYTHLDVYKRQAPAWTLYKPSS